jgi:hypothetical protein
VEEVQRSLEGDRCDANYVRVFGFKTRLFAGGMISDKPGPRWDRVKDEIQEAGVRIIRLKRVNRLEQALSVFWKKRPVELEGGNGKLVRGPSRRPVDAPRPVKDYATLDDILAVIEKRERLLDAAAEHMRVPTLTVTYEELTRDHRGTLRKLSQFLSVKLSETALESIPEASRWFKQGPANVCKSVEDYGPFCMYYSKSTYSEHLPDPCIPGVWDCCQCKPGFRMIFPG